MRQVQIHKQPTRTTRSTSRANRYELDLRTPSGRVLPY
jgi:hypothetical protein